MMRALLTITAILEVATGIAILAIPSAVTTVLLGAPLASPEGHAVARVAGAALVSLGIACWATRANPHGRAVRGLVAAMLVYNVAVCAILIQAHLGPGLSGIGLWPAVVLHAALAVWCVICLRIRPVWSRA